MLLFVLLCQCCFLSMYIISLLTWLKRGLMSSLSVLLIVHLTVSPFTILTYFAYMTIMHQKLNDSFIKCFYVINILYLRVGVVLNAHLIKEKILEMLKHLWTCNIKHKMFHFLRDMVFLLLLACLTRREEKHYKSSSAPTSQVNDPVYHCKFFYSIHFKLPNPLTLK